MKITFALGLLFPWTCLAYLSPPQYTSLVPPGAVEVLEKENQLKQICPPAQTKDLAKCKADKLRPQDWTLTLYELPQFESKKIGHILITAVPGKTLTARFFNDADQSVPLLPHSPGKDWSYSSFFEFTVSDVKGDWVQLPQKPFPKPVWVNLKEEWKPFNKGNGYIPTVQEIQTDMVYRTPHLGDIVFIRFTNDTFTYRKENSNDMLCGEEPQKVPATQLKEKTLPIKNLYDKDGHLRAWIKYWAGC